MALARMRCILVVGLFALLSSSTHAQDQGTQATVESTTDADTTLTLFPHSDKTRWWVSGQFNTIFQGHPSFFAATSGTNSLSSAAELHDSRVLTLYLGFALTHTSEVFLDVESVGGRGLSDALGLAGFTNLDVVRNPDLGAAPYIARVMFRQIIPLSHEMTDADRGPLSLATKVPVRRLEFRAGKLSMPDFFDVNAVGGDDHLQV